MDNSRGAGAGAARRWEEQRLFERAAFKRHRSSKEERLLAFRAALLEATGGEPSKHHKETVDEYIKFLDWLHENVRKF